jgi:hypothetical protein
MGKQPITWIELIQEHIKEKKGNTNDKVGVKDVVQDARKVWSEIKNGDHDKYIKGSSKGKPRSSKKAKKSKKGKKGKTEKNTTPENDNEEPEPGHKGAPSKTRPGHIDFRTHKGDKYYNRDGHRQTANRKGKKGKPYSGKKTKKNRGCKKCDELQEQINILQEEVNQLKENTNEN